ncbi:Succinate dehydrogenase cytochrome B subunit [Yarrowia sp. B02]|nr:Succinate dehydrogenase cytochrome B subunit [Yarrowia sp. B02]
MIRTIAQQSFRVARPTLRQGPLAAYRCLQTQNTTPAEALDILNKQRALRPTSPHLDIYQPQLTWYLSGLHRVTGVALGGALYALLCAYAAGPALGIHIDSTTLAHSFAAVPLVAKIPLKALVAFPFTFHAFNGVRHLIWDFTKELTVKGVYRTGYAVLGLSVLSAAVLAFI